VSRLDGELIAWLGTDGGGTTPDVATIGGKGASLARLASLGFRVPPGFCLTTAAFRAQLDGLSARSEADIAAMLGRGPLLEAPARELARALDVLCADLASSGFAPRFAVRSSAVAEDGAATSYAGLHETELDVPPDGIDAAVRRCWASLWSPAAVAYRERRNLPADDAAMAVVVQALVPADASAVVFTCHPVTGREDQVVLTSTRGLGDAMVAGTITPDTTVVDKVTRTIIEFDPGDAWEGGSAGASAGSEGGAGPVLAPDVLDELVAVSLEVEHRFGLPVDIEAAHAGGRWYLLQARPITTGASTDAPVGAA
jgi:rifampicin phosphotransferase